ncbi:MAG: BMP family ABC transporter substrate-binding protein [Propionicimonas sp.]
MKKSLIIPSALGAMALALGGCATPPPATTAPATPGASASVAAVDYTACMVSDAGGFDDKSFNQTAYKGLTDAKAQLGVKTNEIQSTDAKDYAANVQAMVKADCDLIVTVGFALGDATVAAAKANPDIDFAIVDESPATKLDNLKPLVFNTAQAAFQSGYLAAALSATGKVGTFGGAPYPTVTIFMDGFTQGVSYFNKAKGKSVQVLGWNAAKQDGSFIPGSNPFGDVAGGKQQATNLVAQGADILLPVAGPSGEGALQVAKASGGKVASLWVDTDGCVSAADYCPVIPTSVEKTMDLAVFETIKSGVAKTFSSDPYIGTLENGGVKISAFHEWDAKVTAETRSELDKIKADIISGAIMIESKAQPK